MILPPIVGKGVAVHDDGEEHALKEESDYSLRVFFPFGEPPKRLEDKFQGVFQDFWSATRSHLP